MSRRYSAKAGSVVQIALGERTLSFGRLLDRPLFEFYDLRVVDTSQFEPSTLTQAKVIFRIDVMDSAVLSGRWPVVGFLPLTDEEFARREQFFKQDPLTGALSVYWEDRRSVEVFERPAELAECLRLERAAAWDATHVEDRLRDYFAGVSNKWVESMRPKPPS